MVEPPRCYTGLNCGIVIPENGNSTIRFSVFELDLKAGELRRNGSKIRLQEQPFQILVSLLEHPGEVVSREELRRRLWPVDTFVDFDHSLNAAIRRLRDALGDSADAPHFVETVARRGYRFIAPVSLPAGAKNEPTPQIQAARSELESTAPGQQQTSSPAAPSSEPRWRKRPALIAGAGMLIPVLLIAFYFYYFRRVPARTSISQRRLTANRSETPVLGAALSPSGRYLAFADTSGLYLRQIDSGETHPIPLQVGNASVRDLPEAARFSANPLSWFPDDSHLLATTGIGDTAKLWRLSVLGGEPYLLSDNASFAVVSPDGSRIAFVRGVRTGSLQEIWLMQANGEKPIKLVSCSGCFLGGLGWSPDGQQLAYVRQQYQVGSFWGSESQLEILNPATAQSEVLETHVGAALAWLADGRIIYVKGEIPPNQSDSNLWAVRVNPRTSHAEGTPERITNGSGLIAGVSASADGKRLAILRRTVQPNVYIAELENHGRRLSTPRLLTPDEWYDFPTAWTADSKSVLFFSDRDGLFHIFKQAIDQTQPELLVGGREAVALPRLSPDGSLVLFVNSAYKPILREQDSSDRELTATPQRLMRVPVSGGPPQLVLEGNGINNLQCARLPSKVCIVSELAPNEEHFYTFDPLKGKGPEIPRATIRESDFYSFNWSLSPDGKLLAFSNKFGSERQPAIRVFSLVDSTERHIPLAGWTRIESLDWAADGNSLWATAFSTSATNVWTTGFSQTGSFTLLNVSLSGKVTPMLHETEKTLGWAIPSPDGSRLALWMAAGASNVWLLEFQ